MRRMSLGNIGTGFITKGHPANTRIAGSTAVASLPVATGGKAVNLKRGTVVVGAINISPGSAIAHLVTSATKAAFWTHVIEIDQ